jgi:hypothetical protein
MDNVKECGWFHNWLKLGPYPIVQPKLGPFDPRSDAERTDDQCKSICVDCGKVKYESFDDFYYA